MPDDDGTELEAPARETIAIARGCRIAADELRWRFLPSGGPGGQHANRANTRAELRFDIAGSPSLTDAQRERLVERLGPQLRITCDQERSQARNRAIALDRFVARLAEALRRDPPRKARRVPRAVNERRLEQKRKRSETKQRRRWPSADE